MLVDSHCHLDKLALDKYQGSLDLALQQAAQQGVEYYLCVCIDLLHFPDILAIANRYHNVKVTVGLHPNEKVSMEPTVAELVQLAEHPLVLGMGETGLDYYRSEGDCAWQRARFRRHINAAKTVKKPLIVHTRQAPEDTLQILKEENATSVGGVMHCFTESWEVAKQALDLGFYISFSGIATFQNARALHEVVKKVPLEKMLIETDAPYLAPVPYRGKPNEPAYVRYIAEAIAILKNVDFDTVAKKTTENFYKLFSVPL